MENSITTQQQSLSYQQKNTKTSPKTKHPHAPLAVTTQSLHTTIRISRTVTTSHDIGAGTSDYRQNELSHEPPPAKSARFATPARAERREQLTA